MLDSQIHDQQNRPRRGPTRRRADPASGVGIISFLLIFLTFRFTHIMNQNFLKNPDAPGALPRRCGVPYEDMPEQSGAGIFPENTNAIIGQR
jgi:hypothetical protein